MTGRELYEAIGQIDDRYLEIVDAPNKEDTNMIQKHFSVRKAVTYILAAAICISILAVTAMAVGWIPNIFLSLKEQYPEDQELFEAAATANATVEPITFPVEIPEVDASKLTLFEKYYDGQTILLGYNLEEIIPAPVVGYALDEALLQEIKSDPGSYAFTYAEDENDSVDNLLAEGVIDQKDYEEILNGRTDYAKKYDLRNENNIMMDHRLKEMLAEEAYEAFWNQLVSNGSCCVVMQSIYIGDHKYVNGEDIRDPNEMREYETDAGSCLRLEALPEVGQDQQSVTVDLKLKSSTVYWYMELEGHAYMKYVPNQEQIISFTLENVNN